MAKMFLKNQILAKSVKMQRLFLAPTWTSLCTQKGPSMQRR